MTGRAARLILAVLLASGADRACAGDGLYGTWHDGYGRMQVTPHDIRFGKSLVYQVVPAGPFGAGTLFRITKVNRAKDPLGCGVTKRLGFIAIKPLPADPALPGTEAIRVYFHSGPTAPTDPGIENDLALCSVRPYRR